MRETVHIHARQLHHLQQIAHILTGLRHVTVFAVHDQRLGHVLGDGHQRVERAARILEHEADVGALGLEVAFLHAVHLHAQHLERAAGDLLQAGDRATGGGFARTGLAHQTEHLRAPQREVDAVHGHEIGLHEVARIRDRQPLGLDGDRLVAPVVLALDDAAVQIAHDQLLADARHRGEQPLGVVVVRMVEDLFHVALLHHMPAVHHHHLVGQVGDDAHVVGDDQHAGAELVLGQAQQIQDLGLHGHIQCGGRLVGQDQAGVEHQRHRDDDALLLAARELVRIVVHAGFRVGDADLLQDVDGLGAQLLLVLHTVRAQALLDLPADGVHRVEHRVRLLEDHGRLAAAHALQVLAAQGEHVEFAGAVSLGEHHGAGGGGGFGQQLDDRACGHRLAGAGFADHADHGAARDREAHAVHGLDGSGVGDEGDAQILDLGEIRGRGCAGCVRLTHGPVPFRRRPPRPARWTSGSSRIRCRRSARRSAPPTCPRSSR